MSITQSQQQSLNKIQQNTEFIEDEMEEIFELEDSSSLSSSLSSTITPSSTSSMPSSPIQSPLLSASYYKYHHLEDDDDELLSNYDYLLYECFICKQRLESSDHNCTGYDQLQHSSSIVNDQQIEKNNQLITSNYRKWLFDLTPKLPY